MNHAFMITPAEIVGGFLAVCVAITTVAGAITVISGWISKAKNPDKERDAEIAALKTRMDGFELKFQQVDARLDTGNRKFDALDDGSHVMQRALLALLSHAIDGNNEEEMKTARSDLNRYLIER